MSIWPDAHSGLANVIVALKLTQVRQVSQRERVAGFSSASRIFDFTVFSWHDPAKGTTRETGNGHTDTGNG